MNTPGHVVNKGMIAEGQSLVKIDIEHLPVGGYILQYVAGNGAGGTKQWINR